MHVHSRSEHFASLEEYFLSSVATASDPAMRPASERTDVINTFQCTVGYYFDLSLLFKINIDIYLTPPYYKQEFGYIFLQEFQNVLVTYGFKSL